MKKIIYIKGLILCVLFSLSPLLSQEEPLNGLLLSIKNRLSEIVKLSYEALGTIPEQYEAMQIAQEKKKEIVIALKKRNIEEKSITLLIRGISDRINFCHAVHCSFMLDEEEYVDAESIFRTLADNSYIREGEDLIVPLVQQNQDLVMPLIEILKKMHFILYTAKTENAGFMKLFIEIETEMSEMVNALVLQGISLSEATSIVRDTLEEVKDKNI